jgi:ABC-type multidrug transport system ATPase subunit
MEIVYSKVEHEYLKPGEVTGFYGDVLDLLRYGIDIEGIIYDDDWSVKRFLNGHKLRLNSRLESIFNYLDLDMKLLNKKIKDLSKTDFKFILLAYLLVNNVKYIILDYFDVGLTHKDQKRLVRILRNLKSEGIAIIVLSKNLVFLDQIVNSIIVVKNNELVYNGKMSLLISEHIKLVDEPEILRFISLANKRGANLDLTLDSKELLKDIYRSVY